jgi:4-hydroxy-tetrahydrodipicolinate synthase
MDDLECSAVPLIEGVIAPIATPVTTDGGIDFAGLVQLAQWLVSSGVDGIFVAGTTGRFPHFSPKQNFDICRAIVEAVGDSTTVYAGICDSGLHRILANADGMKKAGADIAVTTGPYYLSRLIDEVEADLLTVAERSPLPVIYYNIPEFVGYGLRPEWIEDMADHPNVVGYKDSSNDLTHHLEVLERTKEKRFSVFIGKEMLLADAFRAGAKGLVVSLVQANPDPFVSLARNARLGDWTAVDKNQSQVKEMVEALLTRFQERPVFSTLLQYLEPEIRRHGMDIRLL